jgi:hypothetical protein
MEFGGIFILVILLIVGAILGGGLYALAMWLRHGQLDPEEHEFEDDSDDRPRPEHIEVEDEQRTRLIGSH